MPDHQELQACQTPLVDLLRSIPADARMVYEVSPTESHNIPVGRLCADALAEIERLQAGKRSAPAAFHNVECNQCGAPLAQMEARKDAAYLERNQVVAALAKCFPSGVARTAIEGWSEDWHGCVYIDLPTGQASWHFHDSQAYLFEGLPPYTKPWDGHTTEEKYRRLAELVSNEAQRQRAALKAEVARLRELLEAAVDDGLAAAPKAPVPDAWQPIETAPRGSGENGPGLVTHPDYVEPPRLLLWTSEGAAVGAYDWYYHEGYGSGAEPGVPAWRGALTYEPLYGVTHWMPLPAAPKQEQAT